MKNNHFFKTRSSLSACTCLLSAILLNLLASISARGQETFTADNAAELTADIAQANQDSLSNPAITDTINLEAPISATAQMFINANVDIDGNGYSINMNGQDRAFFIAGGTVEISNVTIQNGNAIGGSGTDAGGGGAGLGGAIFVANGEAIPDSGVVLQTSVDLLNVNLTQNSATGGSGGVLTVVGLGGGGGMGGNGGTGFVGAFGNGETSGGGGGGFGNGAVGGAGSPGGDDAPPIGAFASAIGRAGLGGDNGGNGAYLGGGGGGGDAGFPIFAHEVGGGGGGGVGGQNAGTPPGGNGGFGGGGGGSGESGGESGTGTFSGGNGGFGGGGGAGTVAGSGGFGGGGGGGAGDGSGGFGGSGGVANYRGGNGAALGGALFVMSGASLTVAQDNSGGVAAFSSNTVVNATAGVPQVLAGSAYGDDLFLGGDVIFNIASNLSVNSLGGAGNTSDPNVSQDANDPNALGGIIKTGAGTLTLTGTSYYTGATTIHQGTVALASGATEQGTSAVIVGQNSGDTATLTLGSGSTLTTFFGTNPPIVLGQAAGSTGSLVIGSGAGSSGAILGANIVQGGAGGGSVVFNQNYAAGSGSDTVYPFLSAITGNLQVVQDGPGTTLLQPLANNGVNTFSGGIIVNGGTLQLGNNTALPSGNAITVNGGTFDFNGYTSTPIGALTMSGGTLINSSGNGSIVASSITTASGTIGVPIAGNTSVVQLGVGTTTLTTTNAYGGYTILHDGRLVLAPEASITGTAQIFVGMNSGDIATLYLENSSTLGVNGFNTTNDLPVILGQSLGSSGSVVIGSGSGSSGAYIAARCFQGGAGGGSMVFDQNYAAGSGSNTVYAFLSDITGNLQVIQNGPGTTLLSPLYGSNSYSGATTLNGGTLLATTSGALGSSTNITVNAGATLNLGAGDVAFGNQQFTLNGGEFLLSANQTQNFGNWNILGSSIFDLGGTTSTLTFNAFSINGTLDIWNWSASSDTIDINGATDAPYNNVVFYSDGGTTEIGTGAIIDGRLEAVPEPSPDALLGFGLGALASVIAARRKLS